MSSRTVVQSRVTRRALPMILAGIAIASFVSIAWAGLTGFRNGAVGGVSINADGVVGPPNINDRKMLLNELRNQITQPEGKLNELAAMRMVSLRQMQAACEDAVKNNFGQVSDEVRFLAGLQRIQYVFIYPEAKDIVLAGPGEGWRVDENANVVGVTTGRPVLRLDDLLVALRTVDDARLGGISCSIDPTEEGYRALRAVMDRQRRSQQVNPPVLEKAIKEAFGPQKVTITGVPPTSHFARVLAAADYRMKRIGMNLDPSPVRGLTSYVDLIKNVGPSGVNSVSPRWWLACNYEPLAASEDRLAWELRGPGVKTLTEDERYSATGQVKGTGKASPAAQKWANLMTERYADLAVKEPVFGDLRNLMDMCVVAALLSKERLWDRAGLSVPLLTDPQSELKLEVWNAPKLVAPEVSFLQTRKSVIVTASGGVQVESWQVAQLVEVAPHVQGLRQKATPNGNSLWWQ